MVKYTDQLDSTFGALADPTRRAILATLMLGQASISELAKPHRMSLPAVMKHVRVLEAAGLITQKKSGRTRHCQLAAEPLKDAEEWINQYRMFWQNQFASLDRFLSQEEEKGGKQKWPQRNSNKRQNSK
jgi:DNA-binding transcriptional ArsR family regulator